ncbi:tetratricopeptide repeat protein [Gilvimarinus sp. F26214L]|uniref:tetratricopeptide repeat protein n=1 Tax=Gilvimarinus sp. DZF01 TaxID=3461371 RepID=UPI0040452BE9
MNCRSRLKVATALVLCLVGPSLAQGVLAATLKEADGLFMQGQYEQAAELYQDVPADERVEGIVRASRSYAMVGDYDRALAVCREALQNLNSAAPVATQLAEVLFATGQGDEALDVLETVVDRQDPPLRALVRYGEYLQYRGQREDAGAYFAAALAANGTGADLSSEELGVLARAHWLRGNYKDANDLFRRATRMDRNNLEAQVWWGELFAEKFNEAEAIQSYRTVLQANRNYVPAVVGYARVSRDRQFLEQALYTNPRSAEAFVVYAELALQKNQFNEAKSYLNAALPINPESLEVITPLAGIAKLHDRDEEFEKWRKRAQAIRPNDGAFYTRISEMYAHDYRFREAVEFARKAVEVQPDHWQAYTVLGTNLARMGREDEGRKHLEFAFEKDPYNIWTSNILKVFDTLDEFVTLSSEHFQVKMNRQDALILWPYMETLLEEAWDTMVEKYGFTPETPVLIEVFDKREDFAVRSVGLPDLGPLVGICFGNLITLISPDALTANWQEIVWHEFVHVITLQMTQNRIPRWLSEGISVYEEFQGRPEWGRHQDLDIVRALNEGKVLPVERMDDAFLEARSDDDLSLAYLQSYLVVEYVVAEHGFAGLKKLIKGYDSHASTEEIITRVFSQDLGSFNQGFSTWLQNRVAETDVFVHTEDSADEGAGHGHGVRNNPSAMLAELYNNESIKAHMQDRISKEPRDFQAQLQLGIVLFKEKNYRLAEKHLLEAKKILPHYTGYPSPPQVLTQLYQEQGKEDKYWEEMKFMSKYHQHDEETPLKLAKRAREQGRLDEAEYYLERALAVDPYQVAVHREYAQLADAQQNHEASIREYEIISQLDQTDPVSAYTRLAEAYLRGGRISDARQNSLYALEIAPTYRPAQKVLLEALQE